MSEREKFYDKEIAPALMEIGERCGAEGFVFIAFCEWEPGEGATTKTFPADVSIGARVVDYATQCRGNIDSLIWAIKRDARERGHSSMEMQLAGIPAEPNMEE